MDSKPESTQKDSDYYVYVENLTTNIVYKLELAFGSKTIRYRGENYIVVHCSKDTVIKISLENDYILRYELCNDYVSLVK